MITISPLMHISHDDLCAVISGYVADQKYAVSWQESDTRTQFSLELIKLDQPYAHRYDHLDDETLTRYQAVARLGFSFAAYDQGCLVGLALAEPHWWNQSLWVWEFHVAEQFRRRGLGQQLMAQLAEKASALELRTIVCETQNTNVGAIAFYRQMGFRVEGIDISYYTNHDFPDGEVAIFMKKRL